MMAAAASAANVPSPPNDVDQFRRCVHGTAFVLIRHQEQLTLAEQLLTLTAVPSQLHHLHVVLRLLNDVDSGDTSGSFFLGDPLRFNDFRRSIFLRLLIFLLRYEARYDGGVYVDERLVSEAFRHIVLRAARQAAGLIPRDDRETAQTQAVSSDTLFAYLERGLGAIVRHQQLAAALDDDDETTTESYPNGGFGAVPASAAAVRSLEKQTFRGAAGGSDDDDGFTECSICSEEFVDGGQVTVMPCPSRVHKFHPDCIAKWLGISNMCPLCRHRLPTAS